MTIDERLERLTERHEALTQSVEILLAQSQEQSRTIGRLLEHSQLHSDQLQQDGEHIRSLARIAEMHERRLTALEGGDSDAV
jgi:hypothetical protein